jgi:hypothetical protein
MTLKVVPPEAVDAELFQHRMMVGDKPAGRNKAILVTARGPTGPVDCIVKLRALVENPALDPLPSLCEWLAAAIALHIGVTTPKAYDVNITSAFAEAVRDEEIRNAARKSLGSTFGSQFFGPPSSFTQWTAELPDTSLRDAAATLLAFDAFIHNPDRRTVNPNLLVGRDLVVGFDHGDAFSFVFPLIGAPDPAEDPVLGMLEHHALRPWVRKRQQNLDRFRVNLTALTDEVLAMIAEATPKSWQTGVAAGKLVQIIDVVRRRRDASQQWLAKVEAWLQK